MRFLLALVLLLGAALPASATVYEVDARPVRLGGPTRGVIRTLSQVLALVQPGDTVLLRGTFTGQNIIPARSGVPGRPIVFTSPPGEEPATLTAGQVRLEHREHVIVSRVRIVGAQIPAVILVGSNNNTIQDCLIANIGNGSGQWGHAVKMVRSSDNIVQRCTITDIGNQAETTGDSIWISDGSNRNRLLDNTLTNAGHALIQIGGDRLGEAEVGDTVVSGNTLSNPWHTLIGLLWMARRTVIENNRLLNANTSGGHANAATIQVAANANVIRRNEFVGNAIHGISLLAYNFTDHGETLGQDAIGNQITQNVFYGNGSYALWISEKHGRSVRDNLIANNVFFRNAGVGGYSIAIEHFNNPTAWPLGSLNGNRFLNNVLLRQPGSAGERVVLRIRNAAQGGNASQTLGELQQIPGASGNLEKDPMFVAAPADFHLLPGSPAIDAGLAFAGVDFEGAAPDIGRLESSAVVVETPSVPGAPTIP